MFSFKKIGFIFSALSISTVSFAFGTNNMPIAPSGWSIKESNTNVRIYQKGTEQTYVQVIDVKGGARIRFSQPWMISGVPLTFTKKNLDNFWSIIPVDQLLNVSSMVNGQFFNNDINPTLLSFGVRSGGQLLTYGDSAEIISKKQIEFTDNSGVSVSSVSNNRLLNGPAQNIIIGLDPSVNKSSSAQVGRMYMCSKVNPYSPTSPSQWLVVLSSKKSNQSTALTNITSWGCDSNSIVMFDGSGSTQLKTKGGIRMKGNNGLINQDRIIPQVVIIYNN